MGLQMPPSLMGNVPMGVPPPNMQGLMPGMMQQMLQSVNSPFGLLPQIPMPAAPTDKPNSTGKYSCLKYLSEPYLTVALISIGINKFA